LRDANGNGVRISTPTMGLAYPEEFRARIFQRFAQADSSTFVKRRAPVSGSASFDRSWIVHQGTVSFDSRFGRGAPLHLDFPRLRTRTANAANLLGEAKSRVLVCAATGRSRTDPRAFAPRKSSSASRAQNTPLVGNAGGGAAMAAIVDIPFCRNNSARSVHGFSRQGPGPTDCPSF